MKKKYLILIVLSLVLFASCAKKEVVIEKNQEMNFAMMPSDSAIPLVIAEREGYFEEEGIKVNLELFFSAKDRDSAFHTGNIDGADYDLIAAMMTSNSDFELVVGSASEGSFKFLGSSLDTKDLIGKKIGLSRNSVIEFYTDKFLKYHEIDPNLIQKEEIPQIPIRLQLLGSGELAGAVLPDPLATLAIKKGSNLIKDSVDFENQVGVFVFNKAFATENKELIESFYKAYNKAANYINEKSIEEYLPLLIEKLNFPKPVEETYKPLNYRQRTMPTKESIAEVNEWLLEKELIKEEVKYEDLIIK